MAKNFRDLSVALTILSSVSCVQAYSPGNPSTLNAVPAGFAVCASDGKVCKVPADAEAVYVVYGAGNKFATAQGLGDFTCLPKGFVKAPSASTPQDVGVDDPSPNTPKVCYVMIAANKGKGAAAPSAPLSTKAGTVVSVPSTTVVPTPIAGPKEKPPKTPIDPAQWVVDQAKKRGANLPGAALASLDSLLTPAKGVFLLEDSDEDEAQEKQPGAIVSVKGSFYWARGLAATRPISGAAMAKMAQGMTNLARKLGIGESVPLRVTLFNKGDGLDLEFSFALFEGWKMSGELLPIVKTRVAFKSLAFKMHTKLAGKTPELSMETEGDGFAQVTGNDPWVGLTPAAELSSQGELTFGGAFSGACTGEPTKESDSAKDCQGNWDVFRLGRVTARGGSLRLTMEGPELRGLEASILNGRLGPAGQSGGIVVTGAIRSDVKLKPGFGLVLNTSGSPTLMDVINLTYGPLMNSGGDLNPLNVIYKGLSKLPNPNLPLSQQADIVITPTGFVVENFNYPDPMFYVKAQASSAGVLIKLDSKITGDLDKIFHGDIAGGQPSGFVKFEENNDGFNNGIVAAAGKVPGGAAAVKFIMNNGFEFHSVSATVNVGPRSNSGAASVTYKLLGSERSLDNIPVGIVSDPAALPEYVLKAIANDLVNPPEWMRNIPGIGGMLKVAGVVLQQGVVLAGDTVNLAKDLFTDPGKLGDDFKNVGKDIAAGGQAVGNAIVDLGSSLLATAESIFSPARDTSKDALRKNIPPFDKTKVLSIMCAVEGQRCVFEGKRLVAYGAAGSFIFIPNVNGGIDCTNSNFGGKDPLPNSTKACFYPAQMAVPSSKCGDEGGKCAVSASGPPQAFITARTPCTPSRGA